MGYRAGGKGSLGRPASSLAEILGILGDAVDSPNHHVAHFAVNDGHESISRLLDSNFTPPRLRTPILLSTRGVSLPHVGNPYGFNAPPFHSSTTYFLLTSFTSGLSTNCSFAHTRHLFGSYPSYFLILCPFPHSACPSWAWSTASSPYLKPPDFTWSQLKAMV